MSEIAVVGTHGILVAAWNRNTPGNWSHARVQSPFCPNGQPIFLAVRFRESQDGSSAAIVTINDQTFHVSSQAVAYNGNGHAEIGGDVGILQRVAAFRRSLSDDELNRIREMGRSTEETPAVIDWGEWLKVIDLATGKTDWTFMSFIRDDFQTLSASANGKKLAVLEIPDEPRGAYVLDGSTGHVLASLFHAQHACGPLSVCMGPEGKTVAVGYAPRDVILWNADEERLLKILEGHTNWVV